MCAYARTDVHIAYSKVTNTLPQLHIKCGITKSCPGTHTALQAPMLDGWECLPMLDGWECLRTAKILHTLEKDFILQCNLKVCTFAIRWLASVAKLH